MGSTEFWMGIGFAILGSCFVYLFTNIQDHNRRIQKIEDIQGTSIERLIKDVDSLKTDVKALSDLIYNKLIK